MVGWVEGEWPHTGQVLRVFGARCSGVVCFIAGGGRQRSGAQRAARHGHRREAGRAGGRRHDPQGRPGGDPRVWQRAGDYRREVAAQSKADNPFMHMRNRCITYVACVCVTFSFSWPFQCVKGACGGLVGEAR